MKKILRLIHSNRISSERGQSLVEIAIFLPIFILLIAGIAEMGWYINRYLNMLDASREAARFAADLDPISNYNPQFNRYSPGFDPAATYTCTGPGRTEEYYTAVACYAEETLAGTGVVISPTNGYDDIVISAFTIENGDVKYRFPPDTSDRGWSLTGKQDSQFPSLRISNDQTGYGPTSPKQGILVLEIFFQHRQVLALPFFTIFVPADIGIHVYTIMPNPTAGTAP